MSDWEYAEGGALPPEPTYYRIYPDECVLTYHPMRCVRPDHPTETSDCAADTSEEQ